MPLEYFEANIPEKLRDLPESGWSVVGWLFKNILAFVDNAQNNLETKNLEE